LNYLYVQSSRINITVLSLSLELLCFILCSVGADFFIRPWQNCLFYPLSLTKKPDFNFWLISRFFPLLCLSCMSH